MPVTLERPPTVRLAVVGAAAGFFSGFLGVGGGIVMVPLMVGWVLFDQHRAHATSLAAIVLIAASAVIRFAVGGEVDWLVGLTLAAGGMVGSTIGARWMNRLRPKLLRSVFGLVLLLAGISMVVGSAPSTSRSWPLALMVAISVLVGVGAGIASGLAGIGGGVVMVPAMVFLLGLSQHAAEGTSLVAILFTAIAGTRVNLRNQRVRLKDAIIVGLGGLLLAPIGATIALNLSADSLSRAFGVFIVAVGLRMVIKGEGRRREANPSIDGK